MSEFTKYPLSEQRIPETVAQTAAGADLSLDEIAFHVERGKQLHAQAVREALFTSFCSVGKAAVRVTAAIGQALRKTKHSPS